MKKVIILVLTIILLFTATACTNKGTDTSSNPQQINSSTASSESSEDGRKSIMSNSKTNSVSTSSNGNSSTDSNVKLITDPNSETVKLLIDKVQDITINGKILSAGMNKKYAVGEVDNLTTSVNIGISFSSPYAHIDLKRLIDYNLKTGMNEIDIFIQNDIAEAKIQCYIYKLADKDNENYTIAREKYKYATLLYWSNRDILTFDYNDVLKFEDSNDMPCCTNFAEVSSHILSKNGLKQFGQYKLKDGKYYLNMPARGSNICYIGTILIPKTATEEKLIYSAQSYYSEQGETTYKIQDEDFILVKENGEWLVESFKLPN